MCARVFAPGQPPTRYRADAHNRVVGLAIKYFFKGLNLRRTVMALFVQGIRQDLSLGMTFGINQGQAEGAAAQLAGDEFWVALDLGEPFAWLMASSWRAL
jgi:hypothetical protein